MNRGRKRYGQKRPREEDEGRGSRLDKDEPVMAVPAAASRNIGGMRNDDAENGDEGKDQFGVKAEIKFFMYLNIGAATTLQSYDSLPISFVNCRFRTLCEGCSKMPRIKRRP